MEILVKFFHCVCVCVCVCVCRVLGDIGRSYGCSVVLCHVHMLRSKKLVLNVANAGVCVCVCVCVCE